METLSSPNGLKKYDWSKAWIDRLYVLNSLLADSVFGVIAFSVVKAAELGIRALSATRGECPDFGHLAFADLLHYLSFGHIRIIVCRLAFGLVVEFVVGPLVGVVKGLVEGAR